jgi:transcription elongation factor Elf1
MKLHPFAECAAAAKQWADKGANVYQQFNCVGCGKKQTMVEANTFYKLGKCEECGHITNIEKDGCNYMLHATIGKSQ